MNCPVPKPTRPLTEAEQITSDILTYLDAHGFSAWGQPNRGEYDPKTNKWRPHPNSRRGVPDILGFRRTDGRFLGVEVKAGTDRPRPEQTQFLNELQAAGGLAFIAYSFAGFVHSFQRRGLHIMDTAATASVPPGPLTTYDEPAPYTTSCPGLCQNKSTSIT